MDDHEKLAMLADASRYDLSCACGTKRGTDHRKRGADGMWVYPASVPRGGESIMLKTLLSNACVNDCRYCPFRAENDTRRVSLAPETVARAFMDYYRAGGIHGIFLSSGVTGCADATMDRMVAVAEMLRRTHEFRGFIHLKVLPGASDAAIEAALSLSTCVSLNVEAPTRGAFRNLSERKDYDQDILRPLSTIARLTRRGGPYERVGQTTQFVVGAAGEPDRDIVRATFGLYRRLGLSRVYFSAYQKGLGDPGLAGEQGTAPPQTSLLCEHRLYQADWLLRKYGFDDEELFFGEDGNLPLGADPKQVWAERHPEFWPVDVNRAERMDLLRVPGIGETTADRILELRREGTRLRTLEQVGVRGRRLHRAESYLEFGRARARLF
jgi:predicted DNA-binding helix-hairpin-helix protein